LISQAKEMLASMKLKIEAIIAVPKEERSFENTFTALAEFEAYY